LFLAAGVINKIIIVNHLVRETSKFFNVKIISFSKFVE